MGKTRKEETVPDAKEEKARKKAREAVAKHLRFKVACKNAVIKGKKVEYFVASKALDCLMESKWAKGPPAEGDDITHYFADRSDAIVFCKSLLKHQLIVRVRKVEVKPKSQLEEESKDSGKKKKSKREAEDRTKGKGKVTDSPRAKTDSPRAKRTEKSTAEEEGKKKKKKFRLEIHPQQTFVDSSEDLYFWQFDPPSNSTYVLGFAVVIGAIAVTMQPLWPKSTQVAVWYLSMVLFAVIGVLVGVIVLRWFLYGLILIITVGKVTFWVFPNLDNEKCGFFESFQPFYSVEFAKQKKKKKSKGDRLEPSKEKEGCSEEKEEGADTSTEEGEEGEGGGEREREGEGGGEGEREGGGEGEREGEGDYERDKESNPTDESARQSIETDS